MPAIATRGDAATDEVRDALGISKSIAGINSAFQAAGAAAVAGRERHGDGGAEVLASAAGLSRQEARSQVKTAQAIAEMPKLRDAVAEGRVSTANARRLAAAVEKTSADAVDADDELLTKAESMRPEQFARETRRWTVDRQGDGGESEHARQRARRRVRVWNADDGMVHLHGEFDAVTGKRIGNRLEAEARRMYKADKGTGTAGASPDSRGSASSSVAEDRSGRRSFAQCMADALDNLTGGGASSGAGAGAGAGRAFADICVVAHVDDDTGSLVAELPDGSRLPQAVLDELACHARITGVLYGTDGTAIWRGHSKRTATEAQRQLLIAKHGGCFHCGAHPAMCQCHHITEFSKGGPTDINNMVLICWNCHQKVHHHNWHIRTAPDGDHTLHPPRTSPGNPRYGPAHAPEPAQAPTRPAARQAAERRTGAPRGRPPLRTRPGVAARSRSRPPSAGTAAQQPQQARPDVPARSRSRLPSAGSAAQHPERARRGLPARSRSRGRASTTSTTSTTSSSGTSRDGPDEPAGPSPPSRSERLFTPA